MVRLADFGNHAAVKTLRNVLLLSVAVAAATFIVRRILHANATGLDHEKARELLQQVHAAYAATLAALDPNEREDATFEERDAKAASAAEALRQSLETVRPLLAPRFGLALSSFVDHVSTAQLQIMAFAINRKNRGLPDSAEAENETEDRRVFERNAQPLFEDLVSALA